MGLLARMRNNMRLRRSVRYWVQRRTRGWDDSDTWSLSGTVAAFTLPRLRRFRELNNGIPCELTADEWDVMLSDMEYALETCVMEDDTVLGKDERDWERVERGLKLFGEHFRSLWW